MWRALARLGLVQAVEGERLLKLVVRPPMLV
jgi:hypothetical protein